MLSVGESIAAILAGMSLKSDGYDGGRLAALLGAAVLALYVPIAVGLRKIPFAASTEYESRRKFAEKRLGVKIPRTGDKMKKGGRLGSAQVDLPDGSDESIRVAVGRAYSLGDDSVRNFPSEATGTARLIAFDHLSRTWSDLPFEVFSQRYERGSVLVTTNLPFDEWTDVFGSAKSRPIRSGPFLISIPAAPPRPDRKTAPEPA